MERLGGKKNSAMWSALTLNTQIKKIKRLTYMQACVCLCNNNKEKEAINLKVKQIGAI